VDDGRHARHAKQQAARGPAADTGTPGDRDRKLGELNEKFKNL
jgi:hypothetical protein